MVNLMNVSSLTESFRAYPTFFTGQASILSHNNQHQCNSSAKD